MISLDRRQRIHIAMSEVLERTLEHYRPDLEAISIVLRDTDGNTDVLYGRLSSTPDLPSSFDIGQLLVDALQHAARNQGVRGQARKL